MTSYLETFLALALSIFKHTEYILLKKKRKFTEYIWWIVKKAHSDSDSDSDSDSLVKIKLHVDVVWSQSRTRRNPLLEFGNALSHLTQRSQYKYTITNHIDLCRISQ